MSETRGPTRRAGARPSGARRSPVLIALVAFACGLGAILAGVTLVRAADDAGLLARFGSPALDRFARSLRVRERPVPSEAARRAPALPQAVYEPPTLDREPMLDRAPPPPVARAAARRPSVERKARVRLAQKSIRATPSPSAPPPVIASRQTVCVRVCDGFAFPVGLLRSPRDLPIHRTACEAACPGAETALYTVPPGTRSDGPAAGARSADDGSLYRRLPNAFLHRKAAIAACSCQGAEPGSKSLPILLDPTLRAGDVVVDPKGAAQVYAGSGQVPHSPRAFADFRRSPAITRTAQRQVDRVMGVSQRDAAAREFERALRIRQASLREVAAPAGSAANVRMYQVTADTGQTHASGARIVVVR